MNQNSRVSLRKEKFLWASQAASLGLACWLLGGCVVAERHPRRGPVEARPRETVVVRQAPPAEIIVIREAPPAPRREAMVERERPSPRHVWVAGYWGWRDRHHVWIPGRWELPPHAHAVWVEPRWERRGDGYVLIEGAWR